MTIELDGITKAYDGQSVLENVSLSIADGARIALTGESGAGKSTLLRILLGLEQPDAGGVHLMGDYKYSYLCAGTVFQEDRLIEDVSAVANVAMCNRKTAPATARRELLRLLPEELLDKPVRELSGGERRRVCIVRALSIPADFFVMDEPFTGLDEANRERALSYILEKQGENALVLAAHDAQKLPGFRVIHLERRK